MQPIKIAVMKAIIITSLFFLFLTSCGDSQNTSSTPKDRKALEKEVLDSACTEDLKEFFKQQIEVQSKILTEQQMIKSLENMKKNMKCS